MKHQIKNREQFVAFLEELHNDYVTNGKEWENSTLDRFLEAMVAYAKDIQAYYDNSHQKVNANDASWQVFSDIIQGATIYE
jgi:deoxyadenosine/deoxycytidine kinase